jgi:5,10-methylenetetrahydrofolate reductase
MKISYELNPPKLVKNEYFEISLLQKEIRNLIERAFSLNGLVDGIHLTDSVLGVPRLSSVTAASYIRNSGIALSLSCSLRVRDRNFTSIFQFVSDATLVGVKSLLVLLGDKPSKGSGDSKLVPSEIVKVLRSERYDTGVELNLTVPSKIRNISSIRKKIEAEPNALVTQSISSLSNLGEIVDVARPFGIGVVACIMTPSKKNEFSAEMIGLDWTEYQKEPVDFLKEAGKSANEILLTSPNSFKDGLELLKALK